VNCNRTLPLGRGWWNTEAALENRGEAKSWSLTAELSGVWQGIELLALNPLWCPIKQQRLRAGMGQQINQLEEPPAPQQRSGEALRLRYGGKQQTNLPKQGKRLIPEPTSRTEGSIQNWIAPPCWGVEQTELQLKKSTAAPAENNNSDHPVWAGNLTSPHNSSYTYGQKDQIPLTSQSLDETTPELSLEHEHQDWTPKE
jgi:hypothetical protein